MTTHSKYSRPWESQEYGWTTPGLQTAELSRASRDSLESRNGSSQTNKRAKTLPWASLSTSLNDRKDNSIHFNRPSCHLADSNLRTQKKSLEKLFASFTLLPHLLELFQFYIIYFSLFLSHTIHPNQSLTSFQCAPNSPLPQTHCSPFSFRWYQTNTASLVQ